MTLSGWKCGSAPVLLPNLGKPLISSATDFPVSGLVHSGTLEGCLQVTQIFSVRYD